MILPCSCKVDGPGSLYQEKTYGPKMRVQNAVVKEPGVFCCTVCGVKNRINKVVIEKEEKTKKSQ